jgi:hypothetical protein
MKYLFFCLIYLSSNISNVLFADTLTVTVSGYGNTPDDAERSAIQKAVRKAIGEFVDAETIAQNGELIKDEVLTYSDGFVESKKILTGPEKDPDLGVFAVTIEAKVVRNKLIERLRESKISVSLVSGDDLRTQAVSKVANVQDGRALLNKFMNKEMLPERLLVAEVVSKDSAGNLLRGNEAKPSQRPDYDKSTSELSFFIEIRYDLDFYFEKAIPRLRSLLDKICLKKIADEVAVSPQRKGGLYSPLKVYLTNTTSMPTMGMNHLGFMSKRFSKREDTLFFGQTNQPLWSLNLSKDAPVADSLFVALNTGRDQTGNFQSFAIYQLDGRAYAKFFLDAPAKKIPDFSISLINGEGNVLASNTSAITQHYAEDKGIVKKLYLKEGLVHATSQTSAGGSPLSQDTYYCSTIAPWFSHHPYLTYSPVIARKFTLGLDDVKKISQVRLEFVR